MPRDHSKPPSRRLSVQIERDVLYEFRQHVRLGRRRLGQAVGEALAAYIDRQREPEGHERR